MKITLGWVLRMFYGRQIKRWARERLLHAPEVALPALAAQAQVTMAQWRAVEAVQASLVDAAVDGA